MIVAYRDRPDGSESKLNTYADGVRVIGTILRLFKDYKPMAFFGGISVCLVLVSMAFFLPVFTEYMYTGYVLQFPTLIVCGFAVLAALISFFSGMMLATMRQKERQDFEYLLQEIQCRYDVMLKHTDNR